MVHVLLGTAGGHLLAFRQDRRHLQGLQMMLQQHRAFGFILGDGSNLHQQGLIGSQMRRLRGWAMERTSGRDGSLPASLASRGHGLVVLFD
jgi:hypothetical protein